MIKETLDAHVKATVHIILQEIVEAQIVERIAPALDLQVQIPVFQSAVAEEGQYVMPIVAVIVTFPVLQAAAATLNVAEALHHPRWIPRHLRPRQILQILM